ncbi:MAG: CvpA family protein [Lachnospiraceae bacterium]|nr:CvpA family protein [Lachnospiraceae bacterium]
MNTKKQTNSLANLLIRLLATAIFGAIYFYVMLPAINFKAPDFWFFLVVLLVFFILVTLLTSGIRVTRMGVTLPQGVAWERCKIPVLLIVVLVLAAVVAMIYSSEIFHAKSYYNLLDVQTGDFTEEVAEISYDKIPMLDKDSSVQLGSRALGALSTTDASLVSQFEVSDEEYSQINYQNNPVRVAPLLYGNIIKWFNNRSEGLPGYIVVNMVTQEASLVKLDEGMKYSTCEHFGRNLYRLLRFRYPTMMFGDVNFEIDEDGTPWWVCSRTVRRIGLFGGTDTEGAVLVNAITGESTYYEEVPTWVDRVYSADQLVLQYNYHGTLVNGWINSWLGQKGITTTSDGYNYIAMNDDVYLYTGVTSAGNDESNVGFILVNQRTKEARYYNIPGATEYSAMSSAEGAVQHLGYASTFPILLNISDEPTYFMSLKDSADLVKMYAMVNVTDYQITATGSSVAECQANYEALLIENGVKVTDPVEVVEKETSTVTGTITAIRTVVVDGNTIFYISLGTGDYYAVSAADDPDTVIYDVGDTVTITYYVDEDDAEEAEDTAEATEETDAAEDAETTEETETAENAGDTEENGKTIWTGISVE